jgi:hypothetical protein
MSSGLVPVDLRERNRRVLRVLLAIVGALVLGSLLVGIRW